MSDELKHYGTPRHSGRYPWGSGGDPYQRSIGFRAHIQDLRKQGFTEKEIADAEGISVGQLRNRISIAKTEQRVADRATAIKMKDFGYSNMEIGRRMGINESSVRALLDPVLAERNEIVRTTARILKENVDRNRYIDVGSGVETHMGISRTKLNNAVALLVDEGYKVHNVDVKQMGLPNQFTIMKVLGSPDSEWKELVRNVGLIKSVNEKSDDYGRTFNRTDLGLKPIQSVDSSRIKVRYADEGGSLQDGVIELRRGVSDLDLGGSKYAQVRIGVDGTHFLKGMAIYSDTLPDGVDIVFNTNKTNTGNKHDAMKPMKNDPDNPFGATIKRGMDESGAMIAAQRGALNIVNEEGDWSKWSKTISSQVLSKQTVPLAKTQLDLAFKQKQDEFNEIMEVTNPVVKQKLLESFSDDCDSSAVHLKAAALPRQASKVILPVPALKETEVYAPTFNDGESVVLIRHPHGGTFEIPQLTVNNKSKAAKAIMEQATDAIGINPKVAQKLSGADFDGDTVIVIPNNKGLIKTSASLKGLENFDPIASYKIPKDSLIPTIKPQTKQTKMGEVSNLITDMTIKGATLDELARAVRHSMVVIDSEKHSLDYKQSYIDHGIAALSAKYQNGARGGASTLISKASSEIRVDDRKPRSAKEGGPIDPITGKKVYSKTGITYEKLKVTVDPTTGKKIYTPTGKILNRQIISTKMAETEDAFTLSSGRPIEQVYASYANNLKGLANRARSIMLATKPTPYNPSAKKVYEEEVAHLTASLNLALRNKPLERRAQILANSIVERKKQAYGTLDKDDLKKIRNAALAEARVRTGAHKYTIKISDREWEAIQAGAISTTRLLSIIENSDLDRIKQLATPRTIKALSPTQITKIKTMISNGKTQAEVAEALGISTTTIEKTINS